MFKKNVLGLTILAAGFLLWSCGDGSIDPLSDNEIMMISRFPSTIDYDMLDSIVKACEKDEVCWEKAKKTGEIYKGDYTKVLRDSSGNIVIVEGDSAFIYDKSGKKRPVFNFSSNSDDDDDDDVTSSGSTATSGSSSKGSSASGFEKDEGNGYGDNPDSAGSGAGGKSRNHAEESSSSRNGSGNSSSIDASQYTNPSSSSRGTYTGSMSSHSRSSSSKTSSSSADLSFMSSSSIPTVSMSSIAVEESSSSKQQLSADSESSQGGGGGNVNLKCGNTPISGTCVPEGKNNPYELYVTYKNRPVTYKYTPDAGSCTETSTIKWLAGDDGASSVSQEGGWEFTTTYSSVGTKTLTYFIMDNTRIPCEEVVVESECNTPNGYSCTRQLKSASTNLWKNSPVEYTWTLAYAGCNEVKSVTWGGAVSGSSSSVSLTLLSASSASVTLTVVDERQSNNVSCEGAYAYYAPEVPPTCAVGNKKVAAGTSVTITPSTVTGCNDIPNVHCGYSVENIDAGITVASSSSYSSGALRTFTAETGAGTTHYTLSLENDFGSNTCDFSIETVVPDFTISSWTQGAILNEPGLYLIETCGNNTGTKTIQLSSGTSTSCISWFGTTWSNGPWNNTCSGQASLSFPALVEIPEGESVTLAGCW